MDLHLNLSNGLDSDTHDLSLSPYQQQFFQGWVRAMDAVPPPSLYPNGRDGIGPLMSTSRSIDLVQDAASDCSVVASLCAGVARAERGHDQVSTASRLHNPTADRLNHADAPRQAVPIRQALRQTHPVNERKIHCSTEFQRLLAQGCD